MFIIQTSTIDVETKQMYIMSDLFTTYNLYSGTMYFNILYLQVYNANAFFKFQVIYKMQIVILINLVLLNQSHTSQMEVRVNFDTKVFKLNKIIYL